MRSSFREPDHERRPAHVFHLDSTIAPASERRAAQDDTESDTVAVAWKVAGGPAILSLVSATRTVKE